MPALFENGGLPSGQPGAASLLDRLDVPTSRDAWEDTLDVIAPSRHLFGRDPVVRGLLNFAYNHVGPVLIPYSDGGMKTHFIPHVGLHVVRTFPDPRVTTQYTLHQLAHCFLGWPLPTHSTLDRYTAACVEGEIQAAVETEFSLFERLPDETAGMFDPAYPSLHDAFKAVGVMTTDDALREARRMQAVPQGVRLINGIPYHIRSHQGFQDKGVATTLLRQAAWAEHDRTWCRLNWHGQRRDPAVKNLFDTLWKPDRHAAIFQHHAAGVKAAAAFADQPLDDDAHAEATLRSLLRTSALDLVALGTNPVLHARSTDEVKARHVEALAGRTDDPMPLWNLALELQVARAAWEATLVRSLA